MMFQLLELKLVKLEVLHLWKPYLDVLGRKLGSMVRINGLFHLLINGGWIGVKSPTDPITIDPFHFLGHPSKDPGWYVLRIREWGCSYNPMTDLDGMSSSHQSRGAGRPDS